MTGDQYRQVSSTNQMFDHAYMGGDEMPASHINDMDIARCREIVKLLTEFRKRPGGETSTDYSYWKGYLACYCEQNAIPRSALGRLWDEDDQ